MKLQSKILRAVVASFTGPVGVVAPAAGTWQMFVNFMPTAPDNLVVFFDVAGRTEGSIQGTGEVLGSPGVQIRVRGKTHDLAEAEILTICDKLDKFKGGTLAVEGVNYYVSGADRVTAPITLGEDQNGRRSFAVSYMVTYRKL